GDYGARSAELVEQRDQQQTAAGGTEKIVEVNPVDALDIFRYCQRHYGAGSEKGQGGSEINERQVPVGGGFALHQDHGERNKDQKGVEGAQPSEFGIERPLPIGDDIGENAAHSEPEERNGDGEKRHVVVEHHREDARE